MQGRIELRGIRALGRHGVGDEEREADQPFEVDVDIHADLGAAGFSDDVADTVDYGAVAEVVVGVVEAETHRLLERMAVRIAEEVAALDPRVTSLTVTVRKLRPPVPVDMGTAGVRITWP